MIAHIITLSLLIVVIMALRGIFRPLASPTVIYALWILVAVKLFLPMSFFTVELPSILTKPVFESAESDSPAIESDHYDDIFAPADSAPSVNLPIDSAPSAGFSTDTVPTEFPPMAEVTEPKEEDSIVPTLQADSEKLPDPTVSAGKPASPINWQRLITVVWLTGSIAVSVYFFASWIAFTLRVRRDRKPMEKIKGTKIYVSENAGGSCLVGLIPSIYLTPEVAESEDASLVIVHEYTHLTHGDCLWSAVRIAALIVFWWNPLVWAAAILSKQDAELACDHTVISKLDDEERIKYARIIVDAIPRKRLAVGLGSGQIKERIIMITKKQKNTFAAAIFAVTLAILFTGCSFIGIGSDDAPDFYDEITYDVGLYLKANERDHMIIVGGTTPCIVTGNVSFADLTDGDIVRYGVDAYLDSYPMQAEIYSISKLADGERDDIDESVLNELAERGWIESFMLNGNFIEAYEKAEWIYSLFTGYANSGDITRGEQIMNGEQVYESTVIGEIDTLEKLRELCSEYFSEDITDSLMSKDVQSEYPLYTEIDGKLYRFGGYVSLYSADYDPIFIPLTEKDGVYSVKVQAPCIFDGSQIYSEAICKYIVTDEGEVRFTEFPYMEELLIKEYMQDETYTGDDEPVKEPVNHIVPDLEKVDATQEPGAPFWECIAIYGDPGGYVTNGTIVAPDDGVRYFVFGRPENRWETEIAEYVTYKVVTVNDNITSCERVENDITRFPATPIDVYTKTVPDGFYETNARYIGSSEGKSMIYRIYITGENIHISAFVSGTDLGGEYSGKFTHDKKTGEVILDLDFMRNTGNEVITKTHTVRGYLQELDNLVAFICTDSDGATITEGSPLIFVTSDFNPDDFAERFNEYPEKFLFYHKIFTSDIYLYFCSRSSDNRVNSDFKVYYSMAEGKISGTLDVKLPDDLEYNTVIPIAATGGGGSGECIFYLKLTKGTETFYASFDNTEWGEKSPLESFEYRGVVSSEEIINLQDRFPDVFSDSYIEEFEIFYTNTPRTFTPPGVTDLPSFSPWGNDKMLHLCKTADILPLIYYSREIENGTYGVIKTEFEEPDFDYLYGSVIDILYPDDYNALLTVRFMRDDGTESDVQYRGYAHTLEVDANAIENRQKSVNFKWEILNVNEARNNNLERGRFRPTDYYDQMPDENAAVLFHLKTNGYCYYFCTVGNDFAVYYRSYDDSTWYKFDAKVPEECKYDSAVPLFARVNNEYGNGCQFWLELTNKGNKYYLQFADVYAIGVVANRFDVTEQMQQIYPDRFVMPTDLSITALDDWESFNYDGIYNEKCYDLLHMLFSGESGIPEFDGLGISEYRITRKADMMLYAPSLYLEFTVTGDSMPESLPAGKYSKIVDLTFDVYLQDTEPEEPLENIECLSHRELTDFFSSTMMWNIPNHGEWDTADVLIPSSYLAFRYELDGKKLTLDNFKKSLFVQFGIDEIRELDESYSQMNVYLDRAVYDPATDSFDFWDTRGSQCAYKVTDITMDGETAYITVQLFADEYNLLPSHLVRYKMDGNVFLGCEIIKESKNPPYGFTR